MTRGVLRSVTLCAALLTILGLVTALVPGGNATAQDNPPPKPITLPCATNAFSQVLGSTPIGDGSQTLIQARVIFGPGGKIDQHTHPGTLVMTVESGVFGFTHLGGQEMIVNRSARADREASTATMPHGEEIAIEPGDWFVETGMIHTGVNRADGDTTVLISGLIETGKPLTICVEDATPTANTNHAQHLRNSTYTSPYSGSIESSMVRVSDRTRRLIRESIELANNHPSAVTQPQARAC